MNKKGFTLVELLAVIIILAVVALIATPIILNVVDDAKKSAAESEANLVLSSINNYCATAELKEQMDDDSQGSTNNFTDVCAGAADTAVTLTDANVKLMVTTDATVSAAVTNHKVSSLTVTSNGYTYELSGGKMVISK